MIFFIYFFTVKTTKQEICIDEPNSNNNFSKSVENFIQRYDVLFKKHEKELRNNMVAEFRKLKSLDLIRIYFKKKHSPETISKNFVSWFPSFNYE